MGRGASSLHSDTVLVSQDPGPPPQGRVTTQDKRHSDPAGTSQELPHLEGRTGHSPRTPAAVSTRLSVCIIQFTVNACLEP